MALLYFEQQAVSPRVRGLEPGAKYLWTWFDPRTGEWGATTRLTAGAEGELAAPAFPGGGRRASRDWAARLRR
jgi:hypothetical protein